MSRTIANTLATGVTLSSGDNPVTITSTGRITESTNYAIFASATLAAGWTVQNSGTLTDNSTSNPAVRIHSYGFFDTFTNHTGGLITGSNTGVQIDDAGVVINEANAAIISSSVAPYATAIAILDVGTIVNAGLLQSVNVATYDKLVGSVTNLATGTISGGGGVYFAAAGTVTNAGTIVGTNASYGAVQFKSNAGGRLIVDPGAVFSGKIISAAASTNVIELASSASAGTLSGFDGSSITNFATLQFDTGAAWTVTGNTAAGGLGSLIINGFTTGDTIDLTGFVATSKTFASNALVLTNASNAHATLKIQGIFSSGSFSLASDGGTGTDVFLGTTAAAALVYGQTIDQAGVVAATETVSAGVMTLFNGGGTAVGTISVGTSLSTGDFSLKPDGSGGTDVIVSTVFGTYTNVTLLTNPTTIASTANIGGTSAGTTGVKGLLGTTWTLTNLGQIHESGTASYGISFAGSGTIINAGSGTIAANSSAGFGRSYGVYLNAGGSVTNQSGGAISGYSGIRVKTGAVTIRNAGTITANMVGLGGNAIILAAGGGTITNQAGGTIAGSYGIHQRGGALTVANAGLIIGGDFGIGDAAGVVVNQASIISVGTRTLGYGVGLVGAGTISNLGSTSLIEGFTGVQALSSGTVINAGTIESSRGIVGVAIKFAAGTNRLVVNPGAVFIGQVNAAGTSTLELASTASAGTLSGLGTKYAGFSAVTINSGANWTFSDANTLNTGITLTNGGTLTDTGVFTNAGVVTGTTRGVIVGTGGVVTNQSGGVIAATAGSGIAVAGIDFVTLVNAGSIRSNSSDGFGVSLASGGLVTNQSGGTIVGYDAILAQAVGLTLVNAGAITGDYGVVANGSASTVTNSGGILASGYAGVRLGSGGSVTNQAGGSINASGSGVIAGAPATVVNAGGITGINYGVQLAGGSTLINQSGGTISGSQKAVLFGNTYANRLVVQPNAVFTGTVDGGNARGAPWISTLELASAASTGTFTGLGSQFINFAQVTIDASANWTFSGTQSGFATLTNAGSLGGTYGIKIGIIPAGVAITNQSGGVITGLQDAVRVVTGSGAGTIDNSGQIIGGTTGFSAIALLAGGSVNNASSGLITAATAGVFIANGTGATVTNAGSIGASKTSGVWLQNGGSVTNASGGRITGSYTGSYSEGVYLGNAGTVTNLSGGTIGGLRAIYLLHSPSTVVNAGQVFGSNTIGAGGVNSGAGVYIGAGGLVTNQSGGTISGYQGIKGHGLITVVNAGSIAGAGYTGTGTLGSGVFLGSGGTVTNQSGGRITGYYGIRAQNAAGTVVNAGIIAGDAAANALNDAAVALDAGGEITNQASGTISAYQAGVRIGGAPGTVLNLGHINVNSSGGDSAVYLGDGGSITNGQQGGTVSSAYLGSYRYAVRIESANFSTVTNYGTLNGLNNIGARIAYGVIINGAGGATSALIEGGAKAVLITGSGTVVNYGTILGNESPNYYGVKFDGAGTIANLGTASLIEAYIGIYGASDDTVTNAGTIRSNFGPASAAVEFLSGTNRLIVDPGAKFIGRVTVAGNSTLELASGASTGTLSGLGTQYIGFTAITIDAGANWILSNTNTVAAGSTVTSAGTLTDAGTLVNAGTMLGAPGIDGSGGNNGDDGGTGVIVSGGSLINQKTIIGGAGGAGNSGGTGGHGITLNGGVVTNQGTIIGGAAGVGEDHGGAGGYGVDILAGTLIDSGVIAGGANWFFAQPNQGTGAAIHFSGAGRLVVDPGASLQGAVAANASFNDVLELAAGGSVGTLTGLGTTITNFASLIFDGGAAWTVAGNSSAAGLGTVAISGFAAGDTIDLTDFAAISRTFANNSLVLTDTLGAHAMLAIHGAFVSREFLIASDGNGGTNITEQPDLIYGDTVQNAGIVATTETVSAGVMTLRNGGGSVVGTIVVGNTLSTPDFTLRSDGAGGTDIVVSTATGTYSSGLTLLANPTTISSSAMVSTTAVNGIGVSGPTGTSWTVTNQGLISGSGTNGIGINLASGGLISNQSGGVISATVAVAGGGAEALVNAGSVRGGSTAGAGVSLASGGTVTNQSGGTISGYDGIIAGAAILVVNAGSIAGDAISGIGISLAAGGTVTALTGGMISGGADAVDFAAGHINRLAVDPGATFGGTVDGGNTIGAAFVSTLELRPGASGGTLTGLESQFINFAQTTIDTGANWTLSGSNTVVAGSTVTNSGTLTDTGTLFNGGTLTGNRFQLDNGLLTNNATGVILATSIYGAATAARGVIINAGTIINTLATPVYLWGLGAVFNGPGGVITGYSDAVHLAGTIAVVLNLGTISTTRTTGGRGVFLHNGGMIANGQAGAATSTAAIQGYDGVEFRNAPGTLSNYGTVIGIGGGGISGRNGGSVLNGASGATAALIQGARYGIYLTSGSVTNYGTAIGVSTITPTWGVQVGTSGTVSNLGTTSLIEGYGGVRTDSDGTVINAGTIASNQGTSGSAVHFISGNARLIDVPGAVFIGSIYGGTVGSTSVLELASAASTGTITGLGTSVTNFTSLVFDEGAQWLVAGNSANGLGTLDISGFTVGDTIDLTGFQAVNRTFGSNALVLGDGVGNFASLAIQGGFSVNNFLIAGDGTGGTDITVQDLVPPVVAGAGAGQTVNDNATVRPFSGVTINDPNGGGPTETVTITITNGGTLTDADGTLSGTDVSKIGTGTYQIASGSTAAVTTALEAVTFTPTAHQVAPGGTIVTGMTVSVTDSFGQSATDTTTSVIAIASNTTPAITGSAIGQTVNDNATLHPFSAVGVSDPDIGASETATIVLTAGGSASDADGALSGAGLTRTGTGTYTLSAGTPSAVTTALHALIFTPTDHQVAPGGTITSGMTLSVTDGIIGTPVTDTATSVITTALNTSPVITGTAAGQSVVETSQIRPFAAVAVTDPDAGARETVTIVLTDGGSATDADGALLGGGLSKTGTGTYILAAGRPALVTDALEQLLFTPAANVLTPAGTITTGMTVSVTDGIIGSAVTDTSTSVEIIPCFAAGTRIATPRGTVLVERLREGDMLLTISGKQRPVQWIGQRTVDCRRHISPDRVRPIRIAPHAFGENRPSRALLLSPDHSVFVEDVLIPIKFLVNGATVTQLDVKTVTYYHLELPNHDVVLAEGLPAETYLETGGRFAFENGGGAMQLHPDFTPDEARVGMVWQNFSYAPLIGHNGEVDRVRGRLACQAAMLGYGVNDIAQPKKRERRFTRY